MANMESVKKAAAGFGVGLCSLALTGSAFAGANVKLGADSGTFLLKDDDDDVVWCCRPPDDAMRASITVKIVWIN